MLKIGNIFLQQEIDFLQCGLACQAASHCHANNKTVGSMRDKLMLIQTFMYKLYCYIASVNTKRDWLICGHVTSDKCNVSRRATSEKLLPAPTGHVHK